MKANTLSVIISIFASAFLVFIGETTARKNQERNTVEIKMLSEEPKFYMRLSDCEYFGERTICAKREDWI